MFRLLLDTFPFKKALIVVKWFAVGKLPDRLKIGFHLEQGALAGVFGSALGVVDENLPVVALVVRGIIPDKIREAAG